MIKLRPDTKTVVVVCAFAKYDAPGSSARNRSKLPDLEQVCLTVARLESLFSSEVYQSEGIEIIPPLQCENKSKLREILPEIREEMQVRNVSNLIFFWIGHGGFDAGSFRLATRDTYEPIEQEDGLGLYEILLSVGFAKVNTWTLFVDACYAGAGLQDVTGFVKRQNMAEESQQAGFAALFSSAPYQPARDSIFVNMVVDVLLNGPSPQAASLLKEKGCIDAFGPKNKWLSAIQIYEAVNAEYEANPNRVFNHKLPMPMYGNSYYIFPNPKFIEGQASRTLEDVYRPIARKSDIETHFFPKAVGIDNLESGWHFTGRVAATRSILEWIARPAPKTRSGFLFVLVADGGTGKSALLGRLIALSDRNYRSKAIAQGWNEKADLDLGIVPEFEQIDAALSLRNLTAQTTATYLANILNLPTTGSVEDFVEAARKVVSDSTFPHIPRIILDALDEAKAPREIMDHVIDPLVSIGWKLVVATRRSAETHDVIDLLASLGDATIYSLDQDAQSAQDIYHYAFGRLNQHPTLQVVAKDAAQLIADRAENKFLFARLSTSSLLRHPSEVLHQELDKLIAQNIAGVLEKDIADLDIKFWKNFGTNRGAATTLLTTLAWARGNGVPIRDGIWASMATAVTRINGPEMEFSDHHILWLMQEAGRYIQEDGDGEQAVYRLFHQSLADYFLNLRSNEQKVARLLEECFANALLTQVKMAKDWRNANPYLVRYMPAYLAACQSQNELNELFLSFDWVQTRVVKYGIQALLHDFDYCKFPIPAVTRLRRILTIASHILHRHPEQLIPQLLGRLVPEFAELELSGAELERNYQQLNAFRKRARNLIRSPIWLPELGGLPQDSPLVRIMEGHKDKVSSVAFSPDGNTIVSGSRDGTVQIWDVRTGVSLRTILEGGGEVYSVVVSQNGETIVSGCENGKVQVWDAQSGELVLTLQEYGHSVYCVAMSSDCSTIVWGDRSGYMYIWDWKNRQKRGFDLHRYGIFDIVISPDDKSIITTSYHGGHVDVWNAQTANHVSMHSMNEPSMCVAAPTNRSFISGSTGGDILVWKYPASYLSPSNVHQNCKKILSGHVNEVTCLALNKDGKTIVSGSQDHTVRLWDLETGIPLRVFPWHESAVTSVAVSPDGKFIISGSLDKTVRVWDTQFGATLSNHKIRCVAASPDGAIIASGSYDKTVRVSETCTGKVVCTLKGHADEVTSITISPDGKLIASGSNDNTVRVWCSRTGLLQYVFDGHDFKVNSVTFSPDGKTIVSASRDDTIRIWGARTGMLVRILRGHASDVNSVAMSTDGKILISGSQDNTVMVWDARSIRKWIFPGGLPKRILKGHEGQVTCVAMSPDDKTIVSGSEDRTVRVWGRLIPRWRLFANEQPPLVISGHEHAITCVAVSPDGKSIVSGSKDMTVRVWHIQTGELLQRLDVDAIPYSFAFVNNNGPSTLVIAADQSLIRLVQWGGEGTSEDKSRQPNR